MGCIAQNIVHLVGDKKAESANGTLCFILCLTGLIVTVSTMEGVGEGSTAVLVSTEEVVAYWYMVVYCTLRITSITIGYGSNYLNRNTVGTQSKNNGSSIDRIISDNYYNLLTTVLQLIATRIHLSIPTPYTIGITGFIGVRLFLKMYKQVLFLTPPRPPSPPPHPLQSTSALTHTQIILSSPKTKPDYKNCRINTPCGTRPLS